MNDRISSRKKIEHLRKPVTPESKPRSPGAMRPFCDEHHYEDLFENMTQGVLHLDSDLNAIAINRTGREILGRSWDELMEGFETGRFFTIDSDGSTVASEDWPAFFALRTGRAVSNCVLALCDSETGQRQWLRVDAIPRKYAATADVYAVYVILDDVTEQKQTQDQLAQVSTRYQSILHNAQDFIIVMRGKEILFVNEVVEKLAGCSGDTLTHEVFRKALCPGDYEKLMHYHGRRMQGEEAPTRYTLSFHCADDRIRIFEFQIAVCEWDGKPAGLGIGIDVTERIHAENALRESENTYRTIFETTNSATFIIEEDTTITLVNSKFARMMKKCKEEIEGKMSWTEFVHSDDVPRMLEYHNKRRQKPGSVPNQYECRVMLHTGEVIDILAHVDVVPGTRKSVASFLDVTHLKDIQRELDESRYLYDTTLDCIKDWIHVVDQDLRIVLVNDSLLEICQPLGVTGDPVGRKLNEVFPFLTQRHLSEYKYIYDHGQELSYAEDFEIENRRFYVEVVKIPIFDGDKVVRIVTAIRDRTDQKEAADAMRESELRYRTIFENSALGLFECTCEGHLINLNKSLALMLGYDTAEEARDAVNHTDPGRHVDLEFRETFLRAALQSRSSVGMQSTFRRHDGSEFTGFMNLHCVRDRKDAPLYLFGFLEDITDRVRAQQREREHFEKLAHVSRLSTIGEIATTLAHEVNQPLCAILNYGGLCSQMAESESMDSKLFREYMDIVLAQAERASAIFQRVRTFVRQKTLTLRRFRLHGVISDAYKLIEPDARQKGIHIQLDLDSEDREVRGDPMQIEQVVLNLIRNAMEEVEKSVGDANTITIRSFLNAKQQIEVEVIDTGRPITEQEAQNVFEPFFTSKENGLGIGLSLCRAILSDHNGNIRCFPNEYGGTTFSFVLKAADT